MDLSADVAEPVRQHPLDEGMYVLGVLVDRKRSRLELLGDLLEFSDDRARLALRDNARTPEHARVRDASPHVVERHARVYVN